METDSQSTSELIDKDPLNEGPIGIGTIKGSGNAATDVRAQSHELIAIAFGPLVWCVHFLLSYVTNAIYCAKFGDSDGDASAVRFAILIYTAVAISLIVGTGWFSYRRHRFQDSELPHDADSPEDRYRFLGFAGFLLAMLSFVAVLFTALVAAFVPSCN